MIITPKMIRTAKRRGACREALDWLRREPRTIDDLFAYRPHFAEWAMCLPGFADLLTAKQFAYVVKSRPDSALVFVCARLTDRQFAACVRAEPYAALRHKPARLRLTDRQLWYCAKAWPHFALLYAKGRLSKSRVRYCEDHA